MSAPAATTRKPSGPLARWSLRVLFGVLAVAGIGAIATWVTVAFGGVYGVEFNPETFHRRTFHYYEVPGLGWQVRKVERLDTTGKTEEFLQTNNHIPKKTKGTALWHIVQAHRGRRSWEGDAQILVNYFDAKDGFKNPIWLEWSSNNPKLAAVLWPAISQLAKDELYIYVPQLFELAEGSQDGQDQQTFPTELNSRLGKAYYEAAIRCQQVENHEAAIEYLQQALKYVPANADYQQALSKSKAALPQAGAASSPADASKS